ncbi:MAG: DNA-binding response regulator [Alicyclobacillus sp.]|nr:DNA-binding response regulator [Alicyclobacillus sp.]
MPFEDAYRAWIRFHRNRRQGAAAERLKDGLQHAEKRFAESVWWDAFHTFDALHPEYQVVDFRDGHRYLDFAYIQPRYRIAIEIDGAGPHWRDISADQFCDHCRRQNHLVIDGWYVLRFAFRDVADHPRVCQQTIQQLIGRISSAAPQPFDELPLVDREIVRMALTAARSITAQDVMRRCHLQNHAAREHLKKLTAAGWLEPAQGAVHVWAYRLHPSRANIQL